MADATDMDLVRAYAGQNSEPAFAELVRRHINLVYSVALRFTGNGGDAEDVTQAVFIILARKAAALRPGTVLAGWLYETTRFMASRFLRDQMRRRAHEQKAVMQSHLNDPGTDDLWRQLAPHLEAAMARLGESDRTLLALRFYQNQTGAEAAATLGIREEAVHKRTARALEKLHRYFGRLGISSTTAVLAGTISANGLQAAPAALVQTTTAVAMAKGVAASGSTLTLVKGALKLMVWKKSSVLAAGAIVLLFIGVTVSIPAVRVTVKNTAKKVADNLPGQPEKAAMLRQAYAMKNSVWPALMKYAKEHDGKFPNSMNELRPDLPAELQTMDDDHWRITAGRQTAKPTTPGELTFCDQINQPSGKPSLFLYADGHVEYRKPNTP